MTANRQIIGAQNRALGGAFERQIDLSLLWYDRKGLAKIIKTPEPMRVIKRLDGGKFIACFEKKAQVDYSGTMKSGCAVRIEAKATTTGRFTYDRVKKEQLDDLESHAKFGACCFVLCAFAADKVYRVPWWAWKAFPETLGRKYWTEQDADDIGAERLKVTAGHIGILDGIVKGAEDV